MSEKKLYALTDREAETLRALARESATTVSNYALDALMPLDTDAAVERIARALCSRALLGWAHESAACQNIWRDEARAALNALRQEKE